MLRACAVLTMLLWTGALPAHAQWWASRLPTTAAGDYLNGAPTSDAAGGAFARDGAAAARPAVAFGIPTAFGADWRDAFAALGTHLGRSRGGGWFGDGAVYLGGGLGGARRTLGLEVTAALYDLVPENARERSLSVKLHRRLGPRWRLAAGMENALVRGATDGGKSRYAVLSGRLPLGGMPLTLTLGLGDGRFNDPAAVRRGENAFDPFGGVAAQLSPRLGLLASWTGQDLVLGLSLVPLRRWPLVVTPVVLDVEGRGGHGARLALVTGVAHTF